MLVCDKWTIETWQPDFSSSGLASPTWTRVRSNGVELCNSLEWIEWRDNPVQVQTCDACGTTGCASGGYVHLSVIQDLVLWTTPQIKVNEVGSPGYFSATAPARFGALEFPRDTWESFRTAANQIPEIGTFEHANRRAIIDAWVQGPGRPKALDRLLPMLRARLLAVDTLEIADALHWIEYWLRWFEEDTDNPVKGTLVSQVPEMPIETLYFDGPRDEDWPALAKHRDIYVPVLDPDHIFIPVG